MQPARRAEREPRPRSGGRLEASVGVGIAASILATIALWEGYRSVGYRDVAGVPTACWGDTNDVVVGRRYSREDCERRLEAQAARHVDAVMRCTPSLAGRREALVAAASLAYNIGERAYCRSTVARRFNQGDRRGACDAFLMWTWAGGREVRGLVNRRRFERDLCLQDIGREARR